MRKKDDTFPMFVELKALVEKETNKKMKALGSDNTGEYVSNEFTNLCAKQAIQRESTTPHNPQQNGMAERKNLSIVGVVRVMLLDKGLPLHL